ncbi:uncharacterized protein LOC124775880 [Schistocerca piceifrons]|uniref:uncharacterized protein LOC124775880 n=1 Tax=Schistocerca piceifrons TaxID=274613 RepID=UPI001F5E88A1|nr:uncharacterized protein LOC124775880 [Schistocerca piceifrons]
MCRGSEQQWWQRQRRSAGVDAALLLRAAEAAVRQPMKSLLPRPLATSARVNLNLHWDDLEQVMGAGDGRPRDAVTDNLHCEWLEEQMKVDDAVSPTHDLSSEAQND